MFANEQIRTLTYPAAQVSREASFTEMARQRFRERAGPGQSAGLASDPTGQVTMAQLAAFVIHSTSIESDTGVPSDERLMLLNGARRAAP